MCNKQICTREMVAHAMRIYKRKLECIVFAFNDFNKDLLLCVYYNKVNKTPKILHLNCAHNLLIINLPFRRRTREELSTTTTTLGVVQHN